jgi:MFS family permease
MATEKTAEPDSPPASTVLEGKRLIFVYIAMHGDSPSTQAFGSFLFQVVLRTARCIGSNNIMYVFSILFCRSLIGIDITLATALPRIASVRLSSSTSTADGPTSTHFVQDFDSFKLQGWAASSFVLAQSVFLPFFGQSLRIFSAKSVMLVGVAVFEIGSVVCGAAQNMGTLIAGRTISGLGSAGMFVALLLITSQITRLEDRPKYMGMIGGAFGLSSIIGPLIGGGLTEHVGESAFLNRLILTFINRPPGCAVKVKVFSVDIYLLSHPS